MTMDGTGQCTLQQPYPRRGSALPSHYPQVHSYRHPLSTHVPPSTPSVASMQLQHDYEILTPSQGEMSQAYPSQPFYMVPFQPAWVSPELISSASGPSPGQSKADQPSPVGTNSAIKETAKTAAKEPALLVSPMAETRIHDPPPPELGQHRDYPPVRGYFNVRLLGPLRTVRDTVTGLPEYTLDPFSPSNMEFQRRGEDEISKLLHLVVQYASQLNLQIKYEDPQQREQGAHNDAARAIGKFSLDFRWLMKHLEYNRSIYSKAVFSSSISEVYIHHCCRGLRLKGDLLAHKQHLQDNLQEETEGAQKKGNGKCPKEQSKKGKCGTVASINEFFMVAVELAIKVEESLKDNIPDITIHRRNLKAIHGTFQEFVEYRALHHRNLTAYSKMNKADRKHISNKVLSRLKEMWVDSEEGQQLIAVAFAARCNISIEELAK